MKIKDTTFYTYLNDYDPHLTPAQFAKKIQDKEEEAAAHNSKKSTRFLTALFGKRFLKQLHPLLPNILKSYASLKNLAARKIQIWCKRQNLLKKERQSRQAVYQALPTQSSTTIGSATKTLQAFFKSYLAKKQLQESRTAVETIHKTLPSSQEEIPVLDGYGEFIITQKGDNRFEAPSIDVFHQILPILQKHASVTWALDRRHTDLESRLPSLKQHVGLLNPSLEVTFVPRVLYELTFIEELIKEVTQYERSFPYLSYASPSREERAKMEQGVKDLPLPSQLILFDENSSEASFVQMAYALNEAFRLKLQKLHCPEPAFSYRQLKTLTQEKIELLTQVANFSSPLSRSLRRANFEATNLFLGGKIYACDLTESPKIIEKALSLECTPGNVVLYRGSYFNGDFPLNKGITHSLSYGAGLFAGFAFDDGATAWKYIRTKLLVQNPTEPCWNAHALVLNFKSLRQDVFFVPAEHTLLNLLGSGEYFHARSKIPLHTNAVALPPKVGGIARKESYEDVPCFLQSALDTSGLTRLFLNLKKVSFPLFEPVACNNLIDAEPSPAQ